MITWSDIALSGLTGRDLVIMCRQHVLRGPIRTFSVYPFAIEIDLFWAAARSKDRYHWMCAPIEKLLFNRSGLWTSPTLDESGVISFGIPRAAEGACCVHYGPSRILKTGDNLDPFEVEGLEAYLDVTSEVDLY